MFLRMVEVVPLTGRVGVGGLAKRTLRCGVEDERPRFMAVVKFSSLGGGSANRERDVGAVSGYIASRTFSIAVLASRLEALSLARKALAVAACCRWKSRVSSAVGVALRQRKERG